MSFIKVIGYKNDELVKCKYNINIGYITEWYKDEERLYITTRSG